MYRLTAKLERADPATGEATGAAAVTVEAAAETYDEAYAQLATQVPDGWLIGSLLPDYDRVLDHLHGRHTHR